VIDLHWLAPRAICYLTTRGRVSGRPRTIEIWFGLHEGTLYILSGGGSRSNWVRNLTRTPAVGVRIGDTILAGTARVLDGGAEEKLARKLLLEKYQPGYGGDLSGWARSSLPVAIDVEPAPAQDQTQR
jgi:deazaflavin-dependent oxidoreductase (nitroreductase family)